MTYTVVLVRINGQGILPLGVYTVPGAWPQTVAKCHLAAMTGRTQINEEGEVV